MNKGLRSLLLALSLGPLAGCGNLMPQLGQLEIRRQAAPNPLAGVKTYALARVRWDEGFTYDGKPEAAWLATRSPKQQASFAADKVAINDKLRRMLAAEARGGESFVAAEGEARFTLAFSVHAYHGDEFDWSLRVLDRSGEVVDEIACTHASSALWGFAPQLNYFIAVASQHTAKYLRSRYAP